MSCGCGGGSACGNPCPPGPRSVAFTTPSPATFQNSLARLLVKPADALRNLLTVFGIRPYVVRWVRVRWTGGARGFGEMAVIGEPEAILPTPLILSLDGISRIVSPVGTDEQGGVLLTEVSGCYTEERLLGFGNAGEEIPADENFFYEVEFLRPDGVQGELRRFSVSGVPEYVPDQFGWRMRLERAQFDRTRSGAPR